MKKYVHLIATVEGKILFAGVFLLALFFTFLSLLYLLGFRQLSSQLLAMAVTNVIFGRAAGLSLGFASQIDPTAVVLLNLLIETILVLVIYPLFVFSVTNIVHVKRLEKFFDSAHRYQERYKDKFEKYGAVAIFIFVWLPFWMTGPVVGAMVGYLIGLGHYKNITLVLLGTSLAVAVWASFLDSLIAALSSLGAVAPWLALGFLILVYVIMKIKKGR